MAISNPLLAKIAKRGGNRLIDHTVSQLLPKQPGAKLSLGGKIAGMALVRIATRSVPGAILVGGGLLARAVHRKRQEQRALATAEKLARRAPGPAK